VIGGLVDGAAIVIQLEELAIAANFAAHDELEGRLGSLVFVPLLFESFQLLTGDQGFSAEGASAVVVTALTALLAPGGTR